MNKLENYLVDLLQGNVNYDGRVVEVVKQFSQHPERPVITLDLSGGVVTQRIYTNPSLAEKYIERRANININVWCDTEQQRASITQQIQDLFHLEQNYHYRYCTKYTDGSCATTGTECAAETAYTHKCPKPETNKYEPLHRHHNIIIGTLNIEPPFDLDELAEHPPLLRSVMRCECQYADTIQTHVPRHAREVHSDITII